MTRRTLAILGLWLSLSCGGRTLPVGRGMGGSQTGAMGGASMHGTGGASGASGGSASGSGSGGMSGPGVTGGIAGLGASGGSAGMLGPGVTGGAGGMSGPGVTGGAGGLSGPGATGGADALPGSGGRTGMINPLVPLPANCEPRGSEMDDDNCKLSAFCDGNPYIASCHQISPGRWRCHNDPRPTDRIFEMEGATGLQPCALAIGLNAQPRLVLGEDSCQPTNGINVTGTDGCLLDLVCGPPVEVDLAPGVRAWLTRYGSIDCERPSSSSTVYCSFSSPERPNAKGANVGSATVACRPLLELALKGNAPGFAGPRSCLVTQMGPLEGGCQRSEICTQPPGYTTDTAALNVEGLYSDCTPADGGGSDCDCQRQQGTFHFHLSEPPTDALCAAATTACSVSAINKAAGDPSCKQDSHDSSDTYCAAVYACTEPATFDGRNGVATGSLQVQCVRQERGMPWQCSCASDQVVATFPLGTSSATPDQACARAPQECLKHVPLHLGPYGSDVQLPYPGN